MGSVYEKWGLAGFISVGEDAFVEGRELVVPGCESGVDQDSSFQMAPQWLNRIQNPNVRRRIFVAALISFCVFRRFMFTPVFEGVSTRLLSRAVP